VDWCSSHFGQRGPRLETDAPTRPQRRRQLWSRTHPDTLKYGVTSWWMRCGTFVALAQPFLSAITHPAMLDYLSVDTFVRGLCNFISGSNWTRAVCAILPASLHKLDRRILRIDVVPIFSSHICMSHIMHSLVTRAAYSPAFQSNSRLMPE
jgi:hypothetical protein